MSQIRNKAELYQAAAEFRRQLCLPECCTSGVVFDCIQSQPGIQVAFLPFQSPALRGMCSPGKPGQEDIILLSSRLTGRERGFYAAHEWLHLVLAPGRQQIPLFVWGVPLPPAGQLPGMAGQRGRSRNPDAMASGGGTGAGMPARSRQPGEPDPAPAAAG